MHRRALLAGSVALAGATALSSTGVLGAAYRNILVNGDLALAIATEGAATVCSWPEAIGNFPIATAWGTQQQAPGAVVTTERILVSDLPGAVGAAKLTVVNPATSVTGLDRLQLFQIIRADELRGAGFFEAGPGRPLHFRYQVYSNIDFQISVCVNNAEAIRNFTVNRPVVANRWNTIDVELPADTGPDWIGVGGYACYFQIGLSCGATRIAPQSESGHWNDGHWLMIEDPTNDTFLRTEGAYAIITAASLSTEPYEVGAEPAGVALRRSLAYEEKSYALGVMPGSPNTPEGALTIVADASPFVAGVLYGVAKVATPFIRLFSPVTGRPDSVWDVRAEQDIPASGSANGAAGFHIAVPDAIAGQSYQFHWLAAQF